MRILKVKSKHISDHMIASYLISTRFKKNGYTHVQVNGEVFECQIVHPITGKILNSKESLKIMSNVCLKRRR